MKVPAPSRSQLGTGALVVAALSVGQLLNEHLPNDDGGRLFERPVAIGDTVRMRTVDLTPRSVEGATSVLRDSEPSIRAVGIGVVLRFDVVSRGESTSLRYAELRDGAGRVTVFTASGSRNSLSCPGGPVGIVVHCTAVVEADPDTLPGASIGLAVDDLDPRFDDMAVVDLDVSTSDVEAWKKTDSVEVVTSKIDGL